MNKKVCFITTVYMTIDWFFAPIARAFFDSGYEVHFICSANQSFTAKYGSWAIIHNIEMKRGIDFKSLFKVPKVLKSIFLKYDFDAIYYSTSNASLYTSLVTKKGINASRIYNQWGLRYVSIKNPMKRWILKEIERFTCKRASYVISVSKLNMEFAVQEKLVPANKVCVVGKGGVVGVNTSEIDNIKAHSINKDYTDFLFVGRLTRDKGVLELLDSFESLFSSYKDIRLFIIGRNEFENDALLSNAVSKAKTNPNIVFLGELEHHCVLEYMCSCDILVHPTYREGFSTVIQEAMYCHLPVITTNVPGPSEVIQDGVSGILVKPKDNQSLLRAMRYLLLNADVRTQYGDNGKKYAKINYDMSNNVNNYYLKLKEFIE